MFATFFFCYTSLMSFRLPQHLKMIGCLTLLLCFWSTGDLVVDLVFEEPDVIADASAPAEEPGNAAEHMLMPTQRADHSTGDSLASNPATDLAMLSTAFILPDDQALRASLSNHQPPPISSLPPIVPLRI